MTASQPVQGKNLPARPDRVKTGKEVSRKQLINTLNHLNFKGETVTLEFHGAPGGTPFSVEASPMPVLSDYPAFRFCHPLPEGLRVSALTRLVIPDGTGRLLASPRLRGAGPKGISVVLPETGRRMPGLPRGSRIAEAIRVHFTQNGIAFKGALADLGPESFKVRLSPMSSHYFAGITPEKTRHLLFTRDKAPIFETEARVTDQEATGHHITLRFSVITPPEACWKKREFAGKSHRMVPAPDLVFPHPLTGTPTTIVIDALSAIGLDMTLHEENLPLYPGMVLKNAAIALGDLYALPLTALVAECRTTQGEPGHTTTRCHLAFLSMEPEPHRKLQALVQKSANRDVRFNGALEKNDLWRFFFETGFIYKNKYRLFLKHKETIKQTYTALYTTPTEVTRHVTYQENGRTMGHISMLRYAERAWLVHHHAALKGASIKVGMGVLNHIGETIVDSLCLDTTSFDYLLAYFRPENGFPNFFFNGFAEKQKDPGVCSTDLFAYATFRKGHTAGQSLPAGWTLHPATEADLSALQTSYNATSGGMLIEALNLFERQAPAAALSARYRNAGLKKERQLWAIRHDHRTAAVFIVHTSDVALNMSELTNCIKVCITRPGELTAPVLTLALNRLMDNFQTPQAPVLVHPFDWVEQTGFPYQKRYLFWVLNLKFSDDYMQHLSDINRLCNPTR